MDVISDDEMFVFFVSFHFQELKIKWFDFLQNGRLSLSLTTL